MVFNIFLLVTALCIDTFVASAAYGTNDICLTAKQIALINGICSLCLGISLLLGGLLDSWIPEKFTREICFFSLLFLGCLKLTDASVRRYLRYHENMHRNIHFGFSQLHFIVCIYTDPITADVEQKHCLSWKEVFFFALAMSMDSLFSGTMAAFLKIPVLQTMGAAFFMGEIFTYLGLWTGKKIRSHYPRDISWVGGVLFIILALTKR